MNLIPIVHHQGTDNAVCYLETFLGTVELNFSVVKTAAAEQLKTKIFHVIDEVRLEDGEDAGSV